MSPVPHPPHTAAAPAAAAVAGVRAAWQLARRDADPHAEPFAQALRAYARDAHAGGVPVSALLQALDGLVRRDDGEPGFERVREWAGSQVIRAYFRAD
ncbi:hypothetical protein [Roseisolibacter sp. H3M3-2]|uniref:hypothetical protein n=1 Tax=Roseisolibacter sp. H3M3-2 TaxID=3031323 RepID=UPI0023DC942A|nr:hypothetical protein [Roseisolibacter sp. H3M3-2]MDF1503952.1 hypothetical protein [Roseisolibacter sp. H3M3-2]